MLWQISEILFHWRKMMNKSVPLTWGLRPYGNAQIKTREEVGAKHIEDTKCFQVASCEPIPPLADEPKELIDLDNELLEDPTVATAQMCEESSQKEEEENDVDTFIAIWNY